MSRISIPLSTEFPLSCDLYREIWWREW